MQLTATAALGAASLAGRSVGLNPVIYYADNVKVLFDSAA
jgi:hypothetical protein